MDKITIIGAGTVGEATARILAQRCLCQVLVLVDSKPGVAAGVALDIQEAGPLFNYDIRVIGDDDPSIMADSDLIIITAHAPEKYNALPNDELKANIAVLDSILDDVMQFAPHGKLILVSNPVEALTYYAWKKTGLHRSQIFGQAGVLNSARIRAFVSLETGYSAKNINAMVLGGRGKMMVPLTRFTTIAGIPIEHFLEPNMIDDIVERCRYGDEEIEELKKNKSASDAPAAAIAEMVEAIVMNRRQVMPCVAVLDGEYSERDMAMGVPCVLSEEGMERIIELPLTDSERGMLNETIESIKANVKRLK